jgi:hypothetical protein
MTGNPRSDDGRRDGDALDRAVDDALGAVLGDAPRDLRARVLARLEEPVEERPSRLFVYFRPALLPAAGAVLIVLGVAIGWWRADGRLTRAGAGQNRQRASAGRVDGRPTPGAVATRGPASQAAPAVADNASPASPLTARSAGSGPRGGGGADRVFAASLLEMDALSRPKGVAADAVVAPDEEPESFLPGALGGELGDPIKPIPRNRPIVIPPIVPAPIVDAPPVSTLAAPVSTLSGDNNPRDRTGPGKPEGARP